MKTFQGSSQNRNYFSKKSLKNIYTESLEQNPVEKSMQEEKTPVYNNSVFQGTNNEKHS